MTKRKQAAEATAITADASLVDKSEAELEQFLFGADYAFSHAQDASLMMNGKSLPDHEHDYEGLHNDQLFVMDNGPANVPFDASLSLGLSAQDSESEQESNASQDLAAVPSAVWHDDDDERIQVDLTERNMTRKLRQTEVESVISGRQMEQRLRRQFQLVHPKPSWAEKKASASAAVEDDDSDMEASFLQQTGGITSKAKSRLLQPDQLEMTRLRDANYQAYSESVVEALDWHPSADLLLTAGKDKTLRLFQIDGRENTPLQSVYLKDMPILAARFMPTGTEIIATGRRKYLYSYNLEHGAVIKTPYIQGRPERSWEKFDISPCGKYMALYGQHGDLVLVSSQTKQYMGLLQMNSQVRATAFTPDGRYLLTTGNDGEVYQWDMRNNRRCIHRFTDEGVLSNTALAVSPTGAHYASGSENGVVNVYDAITCRESVAPKPRKSLMNLTTCISQIGFSGDGQVMGVCSRTKKDQLRLVHLPSCRVFANWPTAQTPLNYVQCFGFSPRSNYLAVGNAKGKVLLYNIAHYNSSR